MTLTAIAATFVLAALSALASWVDVRTRRIPDLLNAAIFASGLAAAYLLHRDLIAALIGAGAGYLALFVLNAAYRRARGRDGIGMGDAKLLGALGAWTGWFGLPFILLSASTAGIAFAAITRRQSLEQIPFGPFIAGAGLLVWCVLIFAAPLQGQSVYGH